MVFGNLQEYVEGPKKHATSHNHRSRHHTEEFNCNNFSTSSALLCKYHITKNVRSQVKLAVGTKQVKGGDGKTVKPGVVVEKIRMHEMV